MKNRKFLIGIVSILMIIFTVCSFHFLNGNINKELKTSVTVSMRDLTKVEYYTYTDKENKDLKKITIRAELKNAPKNTAKKISIPLLDEINHIDGIRQWEMYYGENNVINVSHTEATRELVFDSTNLTIDEIKKLFSRSNVTINVTSQSQQKINHTYNVGELLTYTSESGS